MHLKRRAAAAVVLATASAAVLAGCSTSGSSTTSPSGGSSSGVSAAYNAAANGVVNVSSKTGGTLNLLAGGDCDSWDPARTYYGWCWNMQRLFSRTLIGYTKLNGTDFKLGPDLATNMGTHNSDYTEWTYTLRSGLKYADGSTIQPSDIKYAVERLYASSVVTGGPTPYFVGLIDAPSSYKGPYKSSGYAGGDLPDSAISTTSNSITFHLNKPFADFNYLLALPTTAPVPKAKDTGADYGKHPASSGPFEFDSYTQDKSLTLKRNTYWSQSTDVIRKPKVDSVDLTIDTNPADEDAKLKNGDADAIADTTIGTTLQTQALTNPKLKANLDDPAGDSMTYLVIPPSVIPNKDCRLAIFYATSKYGLLQATGGPTAGTIAGSMTPPGIPGFQSTAQYDPYPVGSNGTGDLAKAKSALSSCGKPNGFTTKMAYRSDRPTSVKRYQVERDALAKVGITLQPAGATSKQYYSNFVGSPQNVKTQGFGVIDAGWGADFPTYYGLYQNIANSKAILPVGNSNYGSIKDSTVDSILNDTGTPSSDAIGQKLNHALMDTAIDLPAFWGKYLYYRNPRMTNVTCNNALAFGIYDFVNVGVSGS